MPLRRAVPSIVLVALALAAVSSCGASREANGDAGTPSTLDRSTSGSAPGPDAAEPTAGSTTDGTGPPGTRPSGTAPAVAPEPWSAEPAVDPIGETLDTTTLTRDGRTRTSHLYVPTTLPAGEPVPLLVALHGGTGWGRQFQRSSGFDGIAEANGFLVVFPDGVGVGPTETIRTWNGGVCCGPAARDDVDDVAFVAQLVEQISGEYDIDPDRVYAAGHSNGAVLSIRLACELSETIVAVGFQAASMSIDTCAPPVPVSMLHLHGEADENVPPQGGKGAKGISGVEWRPVLDGLRTIAAANGCPAESTVVRDPDQPELKIQEWAPCDDGTVVEYVLVPGANHAWMGAAAGALSPSGTPYAGFDSSAAIWSFLASHARR